MKSVYEFQVILKYDKTNSYFTLSPIHVYDYKWSNPFYNFKIPGKICGKIQNIIYTH
jgi:hypothetical protein